LSHLQLIFELFKGVVSTFMYFCVTLSNIFIFFLLGQQYYTGPFIGSQYSCLPW